MPVSDWIAAGKAGAQSVSDLFQVARAYSPDYGDLATTNLVSRSKERQAAIAAEARVRQAGLRAMATTKTAEIQADADVAQAKKKAGTARKAGFLGALGSIAGGTALYFDNKRRDEREAVREAERESRFQETLEALRSGSNYTPGEPPEPTPVPGMPSLEGYADVPVPSESDETSGKPSSDTGQSSSAMSFEPADTSSAQGIMSKAAVRELALKAGFSPEQAAITVGIAGGESGFDPTNSTKRKLPGGRKNLFELTGEDSVGLMQINWGYHKDAGWLQQLGITKREDLFDPVKNMRAAKYLFDGRGNFGDWSVYNKGIYKRHL